MWNTRELITVSIATGLFFSFMTMYLQKRFQDIVDERAKQISYSNPFTGIIKDETILPSVDISKNKIEYHETPVGAGERWTPLPISKK